MKDEKKIPKNQKFPPVLSIMYNETVHMQKLQTKDTKLQMIYAVLYGSRADVMARIIPKPSYPSIGNKFESAVRRFMTLNFSRYSWPFFARGYSATNTKMFAKGPEM